MSRIKKWQCPHCSLSCSRRWNLVVHIRRNHGGVGQPIDEQNSRGGRNSTSSNLDGTHIDRRPPPTYNFNRSSINYSKEASKDNGDMINEMHQMLTEIEKRRRKWEEIIEIVRKYQPFPIQTPYNDVSNATIKDKEKTVPQNISSQDKPHSHDVPVQTHNYGTGVTIQKSSREKSSQDAPTSHKGEAKSSSILDEDLVDLEGDVSPPANVKEVFKFDMFGNVVDYYRVVRDPIEELRDFVKQCDKSNKLYQ